ncbi:hypothetical protein [Ferroacidibacillus organovorans]|uniref:Uncharacterized protein n=1 Tax=Ferroacidibacillus organovorans TaxID=1765683 RepID=A0A117SYM4_9BACL|nr:hypothetical protein [Ferroacidibacillus organovorans]KUO97206.1 hypothetical protein ATW55_09815 [Ferroacidibacillus organovorans]
MHLLQKHLSNELFIIQQTLSRQLQNPPIHHNAFEIRLRQLLRLETEVCEQAMQSLQFIPIEFDTLKEELTKLYYADDADQPMARAWVRASIWMRFARSEELDLIVTSLHEVFHRLKRMVPFIEELYGVEQTKYIVPSKYRQKTISKEDGYGLGN